ncbi:maestro heat-like repeat family member 5 isoform X2 [Ornithorhynchus anatinus]|uniref:maestro heat-like repeat family member 5 isoform X2 n=1 Tax=Ornithorhynchus anatinus TaxID=9258 RepID=UPI0010A8E4C4|nr:maestro heat-like repeat family member 5 isoform X2 [Ornithorhynchus anatinus]
MFPSSCLAVAESSIMSQGDRLFSFVPHDWRVSTKERPCREWPPGDKLGTPSRPPLGKSSSHSSSRSRSSHCSSRSSRPTAPAPRGSRRLPDKADGEAICFKMLQDLRGTDLAHVKAVSEKLTYMAQADQNLVLETISEYFLDNQQGMSAKHKFRILGVLERIIRGARKLSAKWDQTLIRLALENMTKITELKDAYQNAASNILVALYAHSKQLVTHKLEEEFLTGTFPHRSLLYTMGTISSSEHLQDTPEKKEYWEEQLTRVGTKSTGFLMVDDWAQQLMWAITLSDRDCPEPTPEKAFLFTYYGMTLRASNNSALVRKHLRSLLGVSHQSPAHREGVALTLGLVANRHLTDAWAVLDEFGRMGPQRKCWSHLSHQALHLRGTCPFLLILQDSQDVQLKWMGSTILLSYGQIAAKAKEMILPWVDNIASRMVNYFHCSIWDDSLKQSFLVATLMLVRAISRTEGAQSYAFHQAQELTRCLVTLVEKEPLDSLCTSARQQAMLIIADLSKLRPALEPKKKSHLLFTCFRSVFTLPPMEMLEKHTCLLANPPDVQALFEETREALDKILQSFLSENPCPEELHCLVGHMYSWLASERALERQRAVKSCVSLLRFTYENLCFDSSSEFRRIGHLVGMLGLLCRDPDRVTRHLDLEGIGYLWLLLLRHKGLKEDLNVMGPELETFKGFRQQSKSPDLAFLTNHSSQIVKAFGDHLSLVQLRDLIWTVLDGLRGSVHFRVEAAADMLLALLEDFGAKLEKVADIGRTLYLQLASIHSVAIKTSVLKALTLLARDHTWELVSAFLEFSLPPDSQAFDLWRAVGTEQHVSPKVLKVLLAKLQERPLPEESKGAIEEKTHFKSFAAMSTLHEVLFAHEFKAAVQEAYPELFLALVTQLHYVFELGPPGQASLPGPQSTALEAVKTLLSTSGHWKDLAHVELQGGWDLFTSLNTYQKGLTLLARCPQLRAVLKLTVPGLESKHERERKVAILIFTEFLHSPTILQDLPKRTILSLLHKALADPSPTVRVISLQGLGNVLFHPGKGALLQAQLGGFLNGLYQDKEQVVTGVMDTMSNVLYRLAQQGAGPQSLDIALTLRPFFDDERDQVRAAAISLFGDLVTVMEGKDRSTLKTQVCRSLVSLLLHLKDDSPAVVTKSKFAFFRCAVFLKFRLCHTLFCTLAWEQGLSARHFIWTCLMSNGRDEFHIHLSQALGYLHSPLQHLRMAAATFIGYILCYHPDAVTRATSEADMCLLFCTETLHSSLGAFEDLQQDSDPAIREFASRHFVFLQEVARLR